MTLAEKLNKYNGNPVVRDRKPDVEFVPDDDTLDEEGTVTDPVLNNLNPTVWFDYHPDGNGHPFVAWAEQDGEVAWYNARSCTWN